MKTSLGVRRLAVLLGSLVSTAWLIFVMVMFASHGLSNETFEWVILVGVGVACFVIPFFLVHGTAWVIRGFQEDKKKSN